MKKTLFFFFFITCLHLHGNDKKIITQSINWKDCSLDISEKNNFFITWNKNDPAIKIWDLTTKEIINEIDLEVPISYLKIKKNTSTLIILTSKNEIFLYNLLTNKLSVKLEGYNSKIVRVNGSENKIIAFGVYETYEWNNNMELINIIKRPDIGTFYNFGYIDNESENFFSPKEETNSFEISSNTEKFEVISKNISQKTEIIVVGN